MPVRAKFRCREVLEQVAGQLSITLEPVTDGSEENRQFFKYTPAGKIQLEIVNPTASAFFKVGQDYYVDFTPALANEASQVEVPAPQAPPAEGEQPAPTAPESPPEAPAADPAAGSEQPSG